MVRSLHPGPAVRLVVKQQQDMESILFGDETESKHISHHCLHSHLRASTWKQKVSLITVIDEQFKTV